MLRFRIFTASPGDVNEERALLSDVVVPELRRILKIPNFIGNGQGIDLESVRWETHSWPDVGVDAQDVINRQIGDLDIFVGVMWKRFGTPTGRALSGTGEEFDRAFELYESIKKPRIMFYFRTTEFYLGTLEEVEQFRKVLEFKARLERLGVRYWPYDSPLEFERYVREHLIRQIFDIVEPQSDTTLGSTKRGEENRRTSVTGDVEDHDSSTSQDLAQKPRVFISYGREDAEDAQRLYRDLSAAGIEPWLDRENILPGQQWQEVISSAIRGSQYFIALLSSQSVNKQGFVQSELRVALDSLGRMPSSSIFVIPVRLDDFSPSDERLARLQWVDMFPEWRQGLLKIVDAIVLGEKQKKREQKAL